MTLSIFICFLCRVISLSAFVHFTNHNRRSHSTHTYDSSFILRGSLLTDPSTTTSTTTSNTTTAIDEEFSRLCRIGRVQEAHSLYWSIWEMDDNPIKNKNTSNVGIIRVVKPTTKLMNHAIGVCARSPSPHVSEAFHIFTHGMSGGKRGIRRLSPNVYTFGSLMSVCARAGDVLRCLELFKSMKEIYGITPNAVIYSTAISACERSSPPQPKTALDLLKKATCTSQENIDGIMSVVGYNAALSVLARVGDWKLAIQLLIEMETQASNESRREFIKTCTFISEDPSLRMKPILDPQLVTPIPDHVTYGTVMAACERAGKWQHVLQLAKIQEDLTRLKLNNGDLTMDGIALSSALHACQQLGMATEALHYLNLMKTLRTPSSAVEPKNSSDQTQRKTNRRRSPLQGPDSVAYNLAISAIARSIQSDATSPSSMDSVNSNTTSRWFDGIRLLQEMEEVTGTPPDVIAYTATIACCAEAGEWKRAFSLLNEMQNKYKIQPNVMTYSSVISACANALTRTGEIDKKFILGAAMQLLNKMKENKHLGDGPNIITYNAAIRTCAEAHDIEGSFQLMDEAMARGLTPTIVTFGSLMTACERVGSIDGMSRVFELMTNQFNENHLESDEIIKPNEIIYGAAISCCRKAGQSDRALQLLKKMIKAGLQPNTATVNTVLMALTEGKSPEIDKALSVFKLMTTNDCAPNRQTFNVLIRSLTSSQRPTDAEAILTSMIDAGLTPDVELYTATVTSYEKNREPLKALQLMESMRERGYDFYDIKLVNEAFKKAIKLVNVVGRRFSS